MFDDLREQAGSTFNEKEETPPFEDVPYDGERRFLGMTAFQRFFVSLLLLFITCLLGSICLLVTGRVALPF